MCKKHSLTLLECLIALFMITLIALPLAHQPAFFFQKEITALKELEKYRIAELSFLEIKNKKSPPWENQRTQKKETLPPLSIDLGPLGITPLKRTYTWTVARPKKEKEETARLIRIDIYFNDKKFTSYNILVEKTKIR